MATRRVFNILVDEAGRPLANVVVSIQLNSPRWLNSETKRLGGWGIQVQTDANGRWEAGLMPNDLLDDPNSYYIVREGVETSPPVGGFRRPIEYLIRVPSTGYTDPIWVHNLLITPPQVTPPATAVTSIGADNQPQMTGDIRLLSGDGTELAQDTVAKTITINAKQNLLDERTHTDTVTTAVQQGMLIVGKLIGTVIKWAGLALGAAGKFLKSTGTDVVWGDVDWTEVQNKPSTFPPSAHTHNAADVAAGQFGANTGGGDYSFPGKVGVGTTAPAYKLDVAGTTQIGPNTNQRIVVGDIPGWGNTIHLIHPAGSAVRVWGGNVGGGGTINVHEVNSRWGANTPLRLMGNIDADSLQPAAVIIDNLNSLNAQDTVLRVRSSSLVVKAGGNVGIGTTAPTAKLHVIGSTGYNQLRLQTPYTPTSSGDPNGNVGDIAWDDRFVYVKTSEGWKRAPLSRLEILQQTSTSYTLRLTDTNNFVQINTTDPATVTIPADTTTNFPIGTRIIIQKYGTGDITIVGGSGVTVRDPNNQSVITVQFDTRVLIKIRANEWLII